MMRIRYVFEEFSTRDDARVFSARGCVFTKVTSTATGRSVNIMGEGRSLLLAAKLECGIREDGVLLAVPHCADSESWTRRLLDYSIVPFPSRQLFKDLSSTKTKGAGHGD